MASRVLVIERTTGKVVSRAFTKFFNWDEKEAFKPSRDDLMGEVRIEEKLDGSIITMFWYKDQWILTSKSKFDSVQVDMAREVLEKKYPGITNSNSTILSTDKTYIFELIHPNNQIRVEYFSRKDLVLLSVIGQDGLEPPPNFDWSVYPFPRPTMNDIPFTDLQTVRRLNRVNEEGLAIKFYPQNESCTHPQRIKVKFELYLDLIKSKSFVNNPNELADLYRRKREMIYTFDEKEVTERMKKEREIYFDGLKRIADDFGTEWVNRLIEMWGEVEEVFLEAERQLRESMERLTGEFGEYMRSKEAEIKRRLAQRIMQDPVMRNHKTTLFAWFSETPMDQLVKVFTSAVKVRVNQRPGKD